MPTVSFRVVYPTTWGQTVAALGRAPELGAGDAARAPRLAARVLAGQVVWEGSVDVAEDGGGWLRYRYIVLDADGTSTVDAEPADRAVPLPPPAPGGARLLCRDTWASLADPGALLARAPFAVWGVTKHEATRVRPPPPPPPPPPADPTAVTLHLAVRAAGLGPGDAVVVLGSAPALGGWRPERALRLESDGGPLWRGTALVPAAAFPVTYRYAVARATAAADAEPELEAGDNRIAAWEDGGPPTSLASDGGWLRAAAPWRGAGLAVPLFSVRSDSGCGCGSFGDIVPVSRWCARAGLRVLQLLPVVDTRVSRTWTDSYPYSALSAFALHPLYLDVDGLVADCAARGVGFPKAAEAAYRASCAALNPLPAVDYPAVLAAKMAAATALYYEGGGEAAAVAEEEGGEDAATGGDGLDASTDPAPSFAAWRAEHAPWLRPYLAHRVLTDCVFGHPRHAEWGSLARPTPADIDRILTSPLARPARFEAWLQWHLWRQLRRAAAGAAEVGVALKGDLPIGVDPHSVDAWWWPSLFRAHASTGAPPDAFDAKGQAWGFPPYAWGAGGDGGRAEMAAWWAARLRHMAAFFALLRVDHVLGFFRVWELAAGAATGLCGQFRPAAAYTKHDLDAAGLWDVDRLADPHITPDTAAAALARVGGAAAVARFTVPGEGGRLKLAPLCATEAKIDALTLADVAGLVEEDGADDDTTLAATKAALLALAQNVCLVRDLDAPADRFHPRFNLAAAPSYAALPDPRWRDTLAAWHDDYYYGARHDALWTRAARISLAPLVASTNMLICGEDLGMVPRCVPPALAAAGVLGLRVQRMPHGGGESGGGDGHEFGDPARYPPLSVAAPSTHDCPPLRAWWEEDEGRRERYWSKVLNRAGPPPPTCTPAVATAILAAHARSPSMLAVFPLQDVLALSDAAAQRPAADEIVNDPSVRRHYWRYRCQVSVQQLAADAELTQAVRRVVVEGGRDAGGGA